ncbi:gluconate 2-dehydrogenase subunit 3 family protein [Flavitalea sp.]|nr:gluconate 2-dehydrogenase subunit 3 family protein [Flavitalea sp.]
MDRRTAVKNFALASGALITLPSWMVKLGLSEHPTFQSSFTSEEHEILAKICDTIIPAGNSVGAISVGVDKYLIKLIDDCYEPDMQSNVKKQLHALQSSGAANDGKTFTDLSPELRLQSLKKLSASTNKDELEFFKLIKSETIRGFTTSQKVMVNYLGYKTAPGHYYGSVNVKA